MCLWAPPCAPGYGLFPVLCSPCSIVVDHRCVRGRVAVVVVRAPVVQALAVVPAAGTVVEGVADTVVVVGTAVAAAVDAVEAAVVAVVGSSDNSAEERPELLSVDIVVISYTAASQRKILHAAFFLICLGRLATWTYER